MLKLRIGNQNPTSAKQRYRPGHDHVRNAEGDESNVTLLVRHVDNVHGTKSKVHAIFRLADGGTCRPQGLMYAKDKIAPS